MSGDVMRLYPGPQDRLTLAGLYLGLGLHRVAAKDDILIYANYIASLDGRISLKDPVSGDYRIPPAIANARDWRLYQELAAQSDVLITSARYFRQLVNGGAQDLLPVGNESAYADLTAWRQAQGMRPQPDIAIVSASLDIPTAALETVAGRAVHVFTHARADKSKRERLQKYGVNVVLSGEHTVDGAKLRGALIACGFRSAYMIAGPAVLGTLVAARALDRLFLTQSHQLLLGRDFHTLAEGVNEPAVVRLVALYLDTGIEPQQTFAQFTLR